MRRKQPDKLAAIAAAALAVFTRDGFAAAQVADIARDAGLSVGTLYLYADSKQALFELALRVAVSEAGAGCDPDLAALPLRARGMEATAALLDDTVGRSIRWPVLKAALRAGAPPDVEPEVAAIVGELFDLLSRKRAMIWLFDRCASELPWMRDAYERMRAPYFGDLARYASRRRRAPRPGSDPAAIDRAAARRACIAVACGGLLGGARSRRGSPGPPRAA